MKYKKCQLVGRIVKKRQHGLDTGQNARWKMSEGS